MGKEYEKEGGGGGPKEVPERPKEAPRRPPGGPQEAPKRPQEAPKRHPRNPQQAPKRPRDDVTVRAPDVHPAKREESFRCSRLKTASVGKAT